MYTAERLRVYYDFDETVLEMVERAATDQNRHHFRDLADRYDIENGTTVVHGGDHSKPFEVLTLRPKADYDASYARILHNPMTIPIDSSIAMRALRLFGADPTRQLMVVGNPAAIGNRYGKLSLSDARKVAAGDLSPTVDPLLEYLRTKHIDATDQIGYSYGADKAATASKRASSKDIAVNRGVFIESASTVKRSLFGLARDFKRTEAQLALAVAAADSPPLMEARQAADSGFIRYAAGLLRASNLAIAKSLAGDHFAGRVAEALNYQPALTAAIVWGTASELVATDKMPDMVEALSHRFGAARVHDMAIDGMPHAGGDDIDLHAAIILHALRN